MGSIPITRSYARVAQLVERDLAKVEAAGSSPVSRSFLWSLYLQGLFYMGKRMAMMTAAKRRSIAYGYNVDEPDYGIFFDKGAGKDCRLYIEKSKEGSWHDGKRDR